jgi:hypothetical protein
MENKDLQKMLEIESELSAISNERSIILDRMAELEKLESVQEYKRISSQNSVLYNRAIFISKDYIRMKQKNCSHPLWYFMRDMTDSYECKTYYTCKCLECGLEEERRSRNFDNVIKGDYNQLREEYNKRKAKPEVKAEQMVKKYRGIR